MNKDFEQIRAGIAQYCRGVHTQEREDFMPLIPAQAEAVLISPGGMFTGAESIMEDFLRGGIRRAYAKIDLIADDILLRRLNEDTIAAIFAYHTDCIRRDTGEPHGIAGLETQIWIREGAGWKLAHVHYSVQK